MSSTSSQSEQYEGGGPSDNFQQFQPEGGDESPAITQAKEIFGALQKFYDPSEDNYDFKDENGNFSGGSLSAQEILNIAAQLKGLKEGMRNAGMDDAKKDGDKKPEVADDGEEPAGDDFLLHEEFEPRGPIQWVINLIWNMLEAIVVITMLELAYLHPSFVSLSFAIAYLFLLYPMTKDIKTRYTWNICILSIILLVEGVSVFFKMKIGQAAKRSPYATKEEYEKAASQMLIMGYVFDYDHNILHKRTWDQVHEPYEITNVDMAQSYDMEVVSAVLNLFLILFSVCRNRKVTHITKNTKKWEYREYMRLNMPEDSEDDDEDLEKQRKEDVTVNIGSGPKNVDGDADQNSEAKEGAPKKRHAKAEQQESDDILRLKLYKKISINWIGSETFYNTNQVFFIVSILCKLMESVTFNSLTCLPGLFILLTLGSMYDQRKKYSRFYRTYSFFLVYWVQFMMCVKLCAQIYMSIPNVNYRLIIERNDNEANGDLNEATFFQVLFGELHSNVIKDMEDPDSAQMYQFLAFFITIFCTQGWKTAKWLEIREKTKDKSFKTSTGRFWEYIKVRQQEDKEETEIVEKLNAKDSKTRKRMLREMKEQDKIDAIKGKKGRRYDAGNVRNKARQSSNAVSAMVLFLAQIMMFVLAYTYHCSAGFFNLLWVILSFILTTTNTLFVSVVIMTPLLSWEFIFIYCSRVPKIRDTEFFVMYGKYFRWTMMNSTLEQFLMLVTLLLFYMMFSSYLKRIDEPARENGLIRFFRAKIMGQRMFWIWVFFACRYIHIGVLIYLFVRGINNLDSFNNLGYMVFFVVYTAYEQFYRDTGTVLIFFTSLFVIGQYFLSLYYQVYMQEANGRQIAALQWWNLFPIQYKVPGEPMSDPYRIKPGSSIYFRLSPQPEDWINIFLMKFLIEINHLYTTEKLEEYKLRQEANHVIADRTGSAGTWFSRFKTVFMGIFNKVVIIGLVTVQGITEVSFIAWLFLALNLVNLAYMIRGSMKTGEIKKQFLISSFIKFYSLIVIIVQVFVLAYNDQINNDPDWVKVKEWLQIIGLKASSLDVSPFDKDGNQLNDNQLAAKKARIEERALQGRMIAMIIFFLSSIYLSNLFAKNMQKADDDEKFTEKYYKLMFEYNKDKKRSRDKRKEKEEAAAKLAAKKAKRNQSEDHEEEESSDSDDSSAIDSDGIQESIFKRRVIYTRDDLIDFYEGVRFSLPFLAYKMLNWWSFFDAIARYANCFVTGVYIYFIFFWDVNFIAALNLMILGWYFFKVTTAVGQRATLIQKVTNVQSQCDVQMARLVTKRFKTEAFHEFLQARRTAWQRLFGVLIISTLLQYPTPILKKIKSMELNNEQQRSLDKVELALFYLGIYSNDARSDLLVVGMLLIGLGVERVAINWLKNRFGCTHFKLQKFVELDVRHDALHYDWDIINPPYDVDRYQQHYFRNDFKSLKLKMIVQDAKQLDLTQRQINAFLLEMGDLLAEKAIHKEAKKQQLSFGDYVPVKVGMRIREMVRFSVQMDCHASDLNLDDQTKQLMKENSQYEYTDDIGRKKKNKPKPFEYESVPVLRKFKIESLRQILKEAVDRKYKISYYKGIQLGLEAVIILLLLMSLIAKANVWSVIYLIFVFRFACTRNKTNLMVRITGYLSFSLFLQYVLYFVNMTASSSPVPFPDIGEPSMANYPVGYADNNVPRYPMPVFFHLRIFRDDLMLSYMLGVGVDQQQVQSLLFDFINIFLMTMYIFEFRNPVLSKNVKKIFWQFPAQDDPEKWARLDKPVQRQVEWLFKPKALIRDDKTVNPNYVKLMPELKKEQKILSQAQLNFAKEYNENNKYDLNYILTNYVDLKYQAIWGEELIREKKWEIKKNCIYFRIVKQGSQLVYLTFHIFTIFVVLLMAAMRQSFFAFVYLLILIPRMKDGKDVLKQRDIQQGKDLEEVDVEIDDLEETLRQDQVKEQIIHKITQKLGGEDKDDPDKAIGFRLDNVAAMKKSPEGKQLSFFMTRTTEEIETRDKQFMSARNMDQEQYSDECTRILDGQWSSFKQFKAQKGDLDFLMLRMVIKYRQIGGDQIEDIREKLVELKAKKYRLEKSFQKKNRDLKKGDRDKVASQQWAVVGIMKYWLLTYALFDITCQIIFQLPMLFNEGGKDVKSFKEVGFRKVWRFSSGSSMGKIDLDELTYEQYINCKPWDEDGTKNHDCPYFKMVWKAFLFEVMNCFIVSIIMLQSEIFSSAGYLKYVTQANGSMDLLIQLSDLKAKSITYVYNNYKIRKILNLQRKREATVKTVEKLKEKIKRWRQFTRTTMVNADPPSTFVESNAAVLGDAKKDETKKKVTIAEDQNQAIGEPTQEEEELDELLKLQKAKQQTKRLSPEDSEALLQKLGYEFVKAKLNKQRICVQLYLWLQNTFVNKLMFKNERLELEELKRNIAGGSVDVPTELQALMTVESTEMIREHYDNLEGSKSLFRVMQANRDKSANILELTGFDKKIKLAQMKMTWEFTRTLPLILHFIETFFYILISQSQNIIYMAMIYSMYQNAGLISLPYPFMVFGYAVLEERQPGKWFWNMVRNYTTFLLFFKFILNLDFFSVALESDFFVTYSALLKIGIYDFGSDMWLLIFYMMPEILILTFLMLHEIKLQLIGLYDVTEEQVEPVLDGIERNLMKGDEDAIKAKQIETQNMCLARYLESPTEQNKRYSEFVILQKKDIREDLEKKSPEQLLQDFKDKAENIENTYRVNRLSLKTPAFIDKLVDIQHKENNADVGTLAGRQRQRVKDIAKSVTKTSTKFDLDTKGQKTNFDFLVREHVVQKTLEADSLIWIEGNRPKSQPKFITRYDFNLEKAKEENWDLQSAGDFKQDFTDKFEVIDDRELNHPGWFERQAYFDKIFPSLKVQKPGYDLYGTTTSILGFIAGYIFMNYQYFAFSQSTFDFSKGQSVLFQAQMAMTVFGILVLIIIERYANRTDTKKVEEKVLDEAKDQQKKEFFSNDDMFKRTTTQRSMTVKLKTVKTSDLDLGSDAAQDFLNSFNNDDDDDIEDARTKITNQQKWKFFIHWVVLICVHAYCFWFIPISSNMQLYGQAACNEQQKKFYGCYNFKENTGIRSLYLCFCLYLVVSGFQISYGFPILKKASSVFQWYNDVGMIIAQVYVMLPFIIEIRCLLDYIFSKTSLDIFQFWQLFNYHCEMYLCWTGNRFYTIKVLGSPQECLDKFIFGILIASGVLFLLIGPFLIFSTLSPLVSFNPVIQGEFDMNLQINKTIHIHPSTGEVVKDASHLKDDKYDGYHWQNITSSMPYRFYHLDDPYLKEYTNNSWSRSKFSNLTETRDFAPNQVQFCVLRKHSDKKMALSRQALVDLKADIVEKSKHPKTLNISLQLDFHFTRAYPDTALIAFLKNNRSLDYDFYNDCNTGQELLRYSNFQCGRISDKSLSTSVIFTQAYNPALVLGQNNWITEVQEKQKDHWDLMHDLKITYYCDDTWEIKGTLNPTQYAKAGGSSDESNEVDQWAARRVDPQTCQLINPDYTLDDHSEQLKTEKNYQNNDRYFKYLREEGNWSNIMILLFSMKVATGFIATYTPSTFYAVMVYGLSGQVRVALLWSTWKGYTYEVTKPVAMMKLCESCYIYRHEENLVNEEESYRMLCEIIRQPQLYKELSGSTLTGSMSPELDHLSPEQKKKLDQLDRLERKGWEVGNLKAKIVSGDRKIALDANNANDF